MKLNWDHLIIDFDHIDKHGLLEAWEWLIGKEMTPLLISSIGDIFLIDQVKTIHWLNTEEGTLTIAADDIDHFNAKMKDFETANNWFMFNLVDQIKASGLILEEGKLFGYKTLPIMGGSYTADNFELIDIEVHFHLSGQIHEQIKDLPDGTVVRINTSN